MGSYIVGNGAILTATFTDLSGNNYDPASAFFTIAVPPTGAKTTIQYGQAPPNGWPSITKPATGVYQLSLAYANLTAIGDYIWRADDGNNVVANEGVFSITPGRATH